MHRRFVYQPADARGCAAERIDVNDPRDRCRDPRLPPCARHPLRAAACVRQKVQTWHHWPESARVPSRSVDAASRITRIRDVAFPPPSPFSPSACSRWSRFLLRGAEEKHGTHTRFSLSLSPRHRNHPGHIDASSRNVDGLSCDNAHGSWPPRRVSCDRLVAASHNKCLPSTPVVRPREPPDRGEGGVHVSPAPPVNATAIATDILCLRPACAPR